ncbi:MAG: neutral/alkaline non-lysosomal ceramidase N-terminal domain-containing protein [Gemmatimonadetes bacterium]|nr:neutral/alkaline non-lysosomal ceramidase N-terminal domain-containing protein [Gemmatimonadota bacterium]
MTVDPKHLRTTLIACLTFAVMVGCASAGASGRGGAVPPGTVPVGVAAIDITPTEPIRLSGYGDRRAPSDSVAQRLWAKALAFGGDGGDPAVLITVDLVGIPLSMTEEVARRLARAGIEREQLVVSATHTHTGPTLAGVLPGIFAEPMSTEQQAVVRRYSEQLVTKLEQVALAALADRRPAHLGWSQGRVGFAANRRVLREGKWTGFGVNPEGPVDHDLPVLRVTDPGGALRAVLLGYASHATTLAGKDNFVHGDWPGTAKEMIERRHPGAVALVTIGAAADANPEPRNGGVPDVLRHATQIADEVDRLLGAPLRPLTTAPRGRLRLLQLPFERTPPRPELERRAQKSDAEGLLARAALERLGRGEAMPATVAYPVQTWTFGEELAMVFLGGEVVVDYARRLKSELDASRLWVNAYSNDVAFYVASKRVMGEGGYEVDRSMLFYGQPARLAPATEDLIVDAVRALLPRDLARTAR